MRASLHLRPLVEDVEERILYSADFAPAAIAAAAPVTQEQLAVVPATTEQQAVDLIFIAASRADAAPLAEEIAARAGPGAEIVSVAPGEDGIARIGEVLRRCGTAGTVQIVADMQDGLGRLGSATLDWQTLLTRAGEISAWGNALGSASAITLYGCDQAAANALGALTATSARVAPEQSPQSPDAQQRELVFVDPRVNDWQRLIADLEREAGASRQFETVMLDPDASGVSQVSQALAARGGTIDALHFITHGTEGAVELGNTWLTQQSVADYTDALVSWRSALAPDAQILFYGCDIAATAEGRALVDRLHTLTGATVAASADLTGNAGSLADWQLEYSAGSARIEALSPDVLSTWAGVLATVTVSTTSDVVDGTTTSVAQLLSNPGADGRISLREAVIATNRTAGADQIILPAGTYRITIVGNDDAAATGDLDLRDAVTITGAGSAATVIDGNAIDRVFHLVNNSNATLTALTITGGSAAQGGGMVVASGSTANLSSAVLTGNSAQSQGGAVQNLGTLTMTDVRMSANSVFNNQGGALYSTSIATLNRVTIDANVAKSGGGIYNATGGNLTLTNATISGNSVSGTTAQGGGIFNAAQLTATNVTITGNSAASAGGGLFASAGTTSLKNTIVAGNSAPSGPDVSGSVTSGGNNLVGNTSGSSGWIASDRQNAASGLDATLRFNGGPTPTHALLGGSAAINAGTSTGAPAVDQRNTARSGTPDIGAYEVSATSNTAPTLIGTNDFPAIIEDDVASMGTLVSSLISGHASDPDAGALSGIAVTAVDGTNGTWQYSLNAGNTWADFGIVSAASARLLVADANTRVRLVPRANANGTMSGGLTYRAWDQTAGAPGGIADTSVNGGTSPYSNATASAAITITPVNDAPVGAPRTVTLTEEGSYTFSAADFAMTDPADAPANAAVAVKIATMPVLGQLTLSGSGVAAGQSVAMADIAAGRLVYTPVANGSGTPYASFTFQMQDDGGTALGGVDLDPTGRTLTLNVSAVNDPPVITLPPAQAVNEDATLAFSAANANAITVTDDLAGAPVQVTLTVTQGTLTLPDRLQSEYQVNTTVASNQQAPRVAMAADGHYVVTWQSNNQDGSKFGVYARIYNADGTARSGEIAVNTTTADDQTAPAVAIDASGRFVIAWQNRNPGTTPANWDIYARSFNADGTALSTEKRINNTTASDQTAPTVAMDGVGDVVIAWQSKGQDNADGREGIYARRYTAALANIGNEFLVNTTTPDAQSSPAIATNRTTGDFVVVWESKSQDGSGFGIFGQRYDVSGATLGNEFRINTTGANDQVAPAIAVSAGGDFVVAWQSKGQDSADGKFGIYAQRFDATGVAQGAEIPVNTTVANDQTLPAVAIRDDGTFTVAWSSLDQDNADRLEGVYAQGFAADGSRIAGEFRANVATVRAQTAPALAIQQDNGHVTIVWQSDTQDGNGFGVFGSAFLKPGAIAFSTGDGIDDATMTFTGSSEDITAALDGLRYAPAPNYFGPDTLAVTTNDLGNTGTGGPLTTTGVLAISVNPVNDAPTLTLPGAQAVDEDTPIVFSSANGSAIAIADIDAGTNSVEVALSAPNGRFNLATTTGITISAGADGTSAVTVRGTLSAVNTAVDGLVYTPNANYFGADTITVTANDLGSTGAGGPYAVSGTIGVTLNSINDAPVNVLPAAPSTPEGRNLVLSSANGNQLSLSDVDAFTGDEEVTLQATHGTLKLGNTGNLSFSVGTGKGGETRLTFRGALVDINAALNGTIFTPGAGYAGPGYIEITSADLGNAGAGGPLGDRDLLLVNITPDAANAAPVVVVPPNQTTLEETPLKLSVPNGNAITVNDDAGGNPIQVTLSVNGGTLTLSAATGGEFQVNTTSANDQTAARGVITSSGEYILVWQSAGQDGSGTGIYGQRYNAEGISIAPEFRVNTTAANDQSSPAIATDGAGGFAVVWQTKGQEGNGGWGIYGQRFTANGEKLGGEFHVNTTAGGDQTAPAIAMASTGEFVVSWQSDGQDGSGLGIYAQRFTSAGVAQGSEFRVNTTTANDQSNAELAMSATGSFVVTWQSARQDGNGWGIYARRYDAAGIAQGGEFLVNTIGFKDQTAAAVAMDGAGNFVVAWQGAGTDYPDGKSGVYAQRFSAAGTALGPQFLVNTTTPNDQTSPQIAMDSTGRFTIVWQSIHQDNPDRKPGVYGQHYDAAGARIGTEFLVNTTTLDDQTAPAVALADSGKFVVMWTGDNQDGGGTGVFAQRFFDTSRLVFTAGDGVADATMTFRGTLEQVNDAMNGLLFTPGTDFDGNSNVTVAVNDLGNSGAGGARTTSQNFRITVQPVNDAPVISVPAAQTGTEDTPFVFSVANGNAVSVSDVDAGNGNLLVTLKASAGTITLATTGGLNFSVGSGAGDASMTFQGSASEVTAALDGLRVDAPSHFTGPLTVHLDVSDQGRSGSGGPLTAEATAFVTIDPAGANTAPRVVIPGPQATPENTPLALATATSNAPGVVDDAGSSPVRVTLTVTNGTVTLAGTIGPASTANTYATSTQDSARLAMTPGGDYIVTWRSNGQDGSGTGIYAQRFNASGLTLGPEFRVNVTTANDQAAPAVAVNRNGEFVIAWVSNGQDGSGNGVYARRYGANGAPLGAEFLVNTTIAGNQTAPSVAITDSGAFVVGWVSDDASGLGVFAQRFDSNGQPLGSETQVNTTTQNDQTEVDVAMSASGGYVVVWRGNDSNSNGIFAQLFDPDGAAVGGEFAVNSTSLGAQATPQVAMALDGRFITTWEGPDGSNTGIFARRFTSAGTAVGNDFSVNTRTAGNQAAPDIAANDSGDFTIAWQTPDSNGQGISARAFRADGTALGAEESVNVVTQGNQTAPAVAMSAAGTYAVAWTGDNQDIAQTGIGVQRMLQGDELTLTAGSGTNDTVVTFTGKLTDINAALDGLVFTPTTDFFGVAQVHIAVDDLGNTGPGGPLQSQSTLDIVVGHAPVLDLDADDSSGAPGSGYVTNFRTGAGAVGAVDADATVTDAYSGNLQSLTVRITNALNGAAEVLAVNTGGTTVIASYNAASATLTLSGNTSVASYQKVLRTLTYNNTAGAPDPTARIVTFVANDGTSNSNVAQATIVYPGVNQPPVATDDTYSVPEDTSLVRASAGVLSNDTDVNLDTLTAILVTGPANGALTLNAGGTFTYTPIANFTGTDSFTYVASDGLTQSAAATVTITVTSVNDAPSGASATVTATQNGAYAFGLADFGFTDTADVPANGFLAVQVTTTPAGGTLNLNGAAVNPGQTVSATDIAAGRFTFTPAPNQSGPNYASFTFQLQDDGGTTNGGVDLDPTPRTMTIDVARANSAPVITSLGGGASGAISASENTTGIATVTAADPDGDALTYSIAGGADAARFGIDASTGALRFLAPPNFEAPTDAGADNVYDVVVRATDSLGAADTQAIAVTVADVASVPGIAGGSMWFTTAGPVAVPAGGLTWTPDQIVEFGDSGDRFDLNGDNTAGSISALAGFSAPAPVRAMHYVESTLTLGTLTPFTVRPGDLLLTLDSILVTLNSADGDPLNDVIADRQDIVAYSPAIAGDYSSGTYFMVLDGGVHDGATTYNVNAFTLVESNTTVGGTTLAAGTFLVAYADPAAQMDVATFTVLGTGAALNTQTTSLSTLLLGAGLGNAASPVTGLHLLTHATAFNDDVLPAGTLLMTVNGSNTLAGVTQDSFDVVALAISSTEQDAAPGSSGSGTLLFDGSDIGLTDLATSQGLSALTVMSALPPNSPPAITSATSQNVVENTTIVDTLTAVDADGNPVAFSIIGGADAGRFTIDPSNRLVFVSAPNFEAPTDADGNNVYVVQVRASDGVGGSADATISVTVTNTNETPAAAADAYATPQDTPLNVPAVGVLANDSDPDGSALSAVLVTGPANGAVSLDSTGAFLYTPNAGWTGTDSFVYRAADGVLASAPTAVTIAVSSVNDAPGGMDAVLTTDEDTPLVLTSAEFGFSDLNDSPANALLAVRITSLPGAGSLTVNGAAVTAGQFVSAADISAGRLVFAPAANANGAPYASLTFQVQDDGGTANGGTDLDPTPRTLTVNVTAIVDAPVALNDAYAVNEDATLNVTAPAGVLANDLDADGNAITPVLVSNASQGAVTLNGDGSFTYAPVANFAGTDTFTYRVTDVNGASNIATVTITVNAVNDAPSGASATVTLSEDGTYTFSGADFGFADTSDSPAHALLTVTIDSLPAAGSLTLTGAPVAAGDVISAADIAADRLVFSPDANASGAAYAALDFRVQDDGGVANGGLDRDPSSRTLTITVLAENDAPSLSLPAAQSTPLDTAVVFSTANGNALRVADIDAGSNVVSLALSASDGTLTLGATAGLTFTSGTGTGDAAVAFRATLADANAALEGLRFDPAGGFTGAASIAVNVDDLGNAGAGGPGTAAGPIVVNVAAMNASPVLSGANNLLPTREDAAIDPGTQVSSLLSGHVTDADAGALTGMAVIAVDDTSGTWQYSVDGGTSWNGFGAPSAASARLLAADNATFIRFVAGVNWSGTVTNGITFRAWDATSGTAGGVADTTVNGGSSAFSTASASASVDVLTVNDAPSGASGLITVAEDTPVVFGIAAFGFTDANDMPGNALLNVKLVSVPAAGSLTLNGAAVAAGQFVSAADIAAGKLVFTPAADASGTPYASLSFQAQDDGGTSNGGTDLDPVARTLTLDVTQVDDAPVLQSVPAALPPGTELTLSHSLLAASDADTAAANLTYSIGALSAARFERVAAPGVAINSFTQAEVNAGDVRLVYAAGSTVSFSFSISDGSATIGPFAVSLQGPAPVTTLSTVAEDALAMSLAASGTPRVQPANAQQSPQLQQAPQMQQSPAGTSPIDFATTAALSASQGRTPLAQEVAAIAVEVQVRSPATRGMAPDAQPTRPTVTSGVRPGALAVPGIATLEFESGAVFEGRSSSRGATLEAFRSRDALRELDELRRNVEDANSNEALVAGSTVALSTGVSIVYVLWLVRSGVLLGSVLSALPAWQTFDPLPVLDAFRRGGAGGDDDDEVEQLFGRGDAPVRPIPKPQLLNTDGTVLA